MTDTYKMTVDLNDHADLGIDLYSIFSAVVVESETSAWAMVERQSARRKARYKVVEIGGDE